MHSHKCLSFVAFSSIVLSNVWSSIFFPLWLRRRELDFVTSSAILVPDLPSAISAYISASLSRDWHTLWSTCRWLRRSSSSFSADFRLSSWVALSFFSVHSQGEACTVTLRMQQRPGAPWSEELWGHHHRHSLGHISTSGLPVTLRRDCMFPPPCSQRTLFQRMPAHGTGGGHSGKTSAGQGGMCGVSNGGRHPGAGWGAGRTRIPHLWRYLRQKRWIAEWWHHLQHRIRKFTDVQDVVSTFTDSSPL